MTFMTQTAAALPPAEATHGGIRRMLAERRRELLNEIQKTVREIREEGAAKSHQKTQLLNRIDEALRHLDEGTYGYCIECAEPIAPSRLRALPFALRCRDCEEMREQSDPLVHVRSRRFAEGARMHMEH